MIQPHCVYLLIFKVAIATATIVGVIFVFFSARATVGAAYALFTAFFSFDNICRCAPDYQHDNGDYDYINKFHDFLP